MIPGKTLRRLTAVTLTTNCRHRAFERVTKVGLQVHPHRSARRVGRVARAALQGVRAGFDAVVDRLVFHHRHHAGRTFQAGQSLAFRNGGGEITRGEELPRRMRDEQSRGVVDGGIRLVQFHGEELGVGRLHAAVRECQYVFAQRILHRDLAQDIREARAIKPLVGRHDVRGAHLPRQPTTLPAAGGHREFCLDPTTLHLRALVLGVSWNVARLAGDMTGMHVARRTGAGIVVTVRTVRVTTGATELIGGIVRPQVHPASHDAMSTGAMAVRTGEVGALRTHVNVRSQWRIGGDGGDVAALAAVTAARAGMAAQTRRPRGQMHGLRRL